MLMTGGTYPRKVMVVDDSSVICRILRDVLERDSRLKVEWMARDGIECLELLEAGARPDVITLDIQMPRLDGLSTLRRIVGHYSIPVVMISALGGEGARITIEALEQGAVDFIAKPDSSSAGGFVEGAGRMAEKVLAASFVDPARVPSSTCDRLQVQQPSPLQQSPDAGSHGRVLVVLGASTGGPGTLELILSSIPREVPAAFLVVQHMPARFTAEFARRLDGRCALRVQEAAAGTRVEAGNVYVAPGGDRHTIVRGGGMLSAPGGLDRIWLAMTARPRGARSETLYVPSVDELMLSIPAWLAMRTVAVLLTGMGEDGVAGMKYLKECGAITIAEAPESCVIFGMPRKAIELGVVDYVLPREEIAERIVAEVLGR